MFIQRLIISLILPLGLLRVAIAYPAPDAFVSSSDLQIRDPEPLGGPPISIQALCEKNCVATKNHCAANGGGLLACEAIARGCIQKCASIYDRLKEKEKRDADPIVPPTEPNLNLEAICDKKCIATKNHCVATGGLVDVCERNNSICLNQCQFAYGNKSNEKRDPVIPPTKPSLNLEAICDKNCTAKRNNCVATGGLVDVCENNHNICLNQCQFAYGN